MRIHEQRSPFLTFLVLLFLIYLPPTAHPGLDTSDQTKRQTAISLFNQGKRLEALPLLEEIAQKDPQDSEVLVALAASLVEHAATSTEADAAAKERFRARNLLQKAWGLGNTSPLAENLRQLLEELPANGAIEFSDNPVVERVMNAGWDECHASYINRL